MVKKALYCLHLNTETSILGGIYFTRYKYTLITCIHRNGTNMLTFVFEKRNKNTTWLSRIVIVKHQKMFY